MRAAHTLAGRWLARTVARFGSTVAVACVASGVAVLLYRPRGLIAGTPLDSDGDVWLYLNYVRNILAGDLNSTARLGAPFGQHLYDYPVGNDFTHFLLIRGIGIFSDNAILVMNLAFLAGFGIVAAVTELVARQLGLRRSLSLVIALLYTFVPYHFAQGPHHIVYAGYWAVPLGVLLVVWTMRGILPIPAVVVPRPEWTRADSKRLAILVACVLVGASSDPYYTFFSLFLIATAAAIASWRDRSWKHLVSGGTVVLGYVAVLIATLVPALIWRLGHGANPQVGIRPPGDAERFGLHLSQLVMPGPHTRWPFFDSIGQRLTEVPWPGEAGSYVGIFALVGLAIATASLLRRGIGAPTSMVRDLPRDLALIAWSALVWATIGGLSGILAAIGFTQLRTWSRMSVYLSLCGLLALGAVAQSHAARILERRRPMAFAALALVGIVGLVDQVPTTIPPPLGSVSQTVSSVRSTVDDMEGALPDNAMVFELPVMSFPEASTVNLMNSTELLIPYLVDHGRLRWSFGGLRGREADWQLNWGQAPPAQMVRGLALAGYDAVYLDRRGITDGGDTLDRTLTALVGPARGASPSGDQSWYDLRPLRRRLAEDHPSGELTRARDLLLHSATARVVNLQPPQKPPNPGVAQWFERPARIVLHNPLSVDRPVDLRLRLSARAPATLRLDGAGVHRSIAVGTVPTSSNVRLTLPPGDSTLVVTSDAPLDYDAPVLRAQPVISATVRVDQLMVTDDAVTSLTD